MTKKSNPYNMKSTQPIITKLLRGISTTTHCVRSWLAICLS